MALKPCLDCGRDGVCVRCGSTYYLNAHHVIPRAEGGLDHPSNLETLCVACHGLETAAEHRNRHY